MEFELTLAIELLERTPVMLKNWLTGLDLRLIENNYGAETFSPYDVIGHLLQGERTDWMARVEIILEQGESRTFTPWDRYAMRSESPGKTVDPLLDEFAIARQDNLERLKAKNLPSSDLLRKGTHPKIRPGYLETVAGDLGYPRPESHSSNCQVYGVAVPR